MTVVNFWVAWKPKREVRKNTGIAGSRAMLPGQPCAKFLKLNRNKIHCEKTYLADYSTSFVRLSLINMRTTEKHARNPCVYRKLDSAIFVVKATENWV
jgi:hypothetical protein